MKQEERVLYTIYKGDDPSPVKVFKERQWTLENRVSLYACIIGKSHRIVLRADRECFTEFIAYPIEDMTPNPLDHFPLEAGKTYRKKYEDGSLACEVNLRVSPVLFEDMGDFLSSLEEPGDFEILQHDFGVRVAETVRPFTGIAVDIPGNTFYTVHTYPEQGFSIQSRSEIYSSVKTVVL